MLKYNITTVLIDADR